MHRRLNAGSRHTVNEGPFGGYGQSGNGREFGQYGLDFLEIKSSQSKRT